MKVKVYSTPTCPYCTMVKEYLSSKDIPFQGIDVSVDKAAADEMVKISGQMGVPTSVIGMKSAYFASLGAVFGGSFNSSLRASTAASHKTSLQHSQRTCWKLACRSESYKNTLATVACRRPWFTFT